jgi:tetratricopeptide (TPR) repeat protein
MLAFFCLNLNQDLRAQTKANKKTLDKAMAQIVETDPYATRHPASRTGAAIGDADLTEALSLAKNNRLVESSAKLFQLSYSPRFASRRMQIKFVLGLTLQKMNLPQLAAFQYMTVVKDGSTSYAGQALDKLAQVADQLGDDSLLNYAYSKIKIDNFPRSQRDRLYLRIGEFQKRHAEFKQAAGTFSHVPAGSASYPAAKYQEGLAYAEAGDTDRSIASFDELIESRRKAGPTDPSRAEGYMGKARALYQKKDWDGAIAAYREVPRDSSPWHDTLFESSWAMLRSGRFRSALSNFHSLHSAFYENTYLPESLILRSIVYLYICKYEETEKILNLFSKMYKPAFHSVDVVLRDNSKGPVDYFNTINKILNDYKKDPEKTIHASYSIPYVVAQKISREADFQSSFVYTKNLMAERAQMRSFPASWRASALGQYAHKVLETRLAKAQQHAGKQIRTHLVNVHSELLDLIEQEGFIRYEIINGRKEELKKKIAGKELPAIQVDEGNERNYYVQNGFEYWPFRGEYWLDELGTYHYVGTQSCH